MKLQVECSWNENQNSAKIVIRYEYLPKSLFSMPDEKTKQVQKLGGNAAQIGPSALDQLKEITCKYPRSLYASFIYYQTLAFFEFEEEAKELFQEIQKQFPGQVLSQCIAAENCLKQKKHEKFLKSFNGIEVLKGSFPRRKHFFFEEALFFHGLWAKYYFEKGNVSQNQKHAQFIHLIMNTLKSSSLINV